MKLIFPAGKSFGAVAFMLVVMGMVSAYAGDKEVEFSVPEAGTPEYKELQEVYRASIAPIISAKCLTCHSPGKSFKAVQRIDMSEGFPFKGAGSNGSRMATLNREVREGGMPPFYYLMFHWSGGLTKEESGLLIDWTEAKLELSGSNTGNKKK